jgi:hypothetical protein
MGLGDLIYYILYYTGVHSTWKWLLKLFGRDCKCNKRRENWNKYAIQINRKQNEWEK